MKTIHLAAVIVMCALSGNLFAKPQNEQCDLSDYKIISRKFKTGELSPRIDGNGNVVSSACRTWPYNPNLLLVTLAYDEGVEYEKKMIVAVIDQKTQRVIHGHRSVIAEDAVTEVGEGSLKIDTARYQLADGVRAFGIQFDSVARGASCGEGYWGRELTLFVPEEKTLKPVLTLNMYRQQWLQGCPASTENAFWEDAYLSISFADTVSNGFRDIVLTAKITQSASETSRRKLKDRTEKNILRYDGNTYQLGKGAPWWAGFF